MNQSKSKNYPILNKSLYDIPTRRHVIENFFIILECNLEDSNGQINTGYKLTSKYQN